MWGIDWICRVTCHGERRLIDHHVDGDRRILGLPAGELDERIDVSEADVVGAVRHLCDRSTRAAALIDREIETLGLEVTAVVGEKEDSLGSLVFPIEHELEL